MNANGRNFSTVVTTWKAPMLRTPVRLTSAGSHRPASAIPSEPQVWCPLLTNTST